jgi:hypothetical protein
MSSAQVPAVRAEGSRWAEWLTVLVLLSMAGVLLWIFVSLDRRRPSPPFPPFDLKNPMLDARPRECVEVSGQDRPNDALCVSVIEDGFVLRPSEGPVELGNQSGLKLVPPYLACRERTLQRGQAGCGSLPPTTGPAGAEPKPDYLLYPLDDFGIPAGHRMRPDSIEAIRAESGGSERLLYLVVLQDYGGGTFKCFVSPDRERGLVTGLVRIELLSEKPGHPSQVFFYNDVGECP